MKRVSGFALAIVGGAILTISLALSGPGIGVGQDPSDEVEATGENGGNSAVLKSGSLPVPVHVEGVALVEIVNELDVPMPVRIAGGMPWYTGVTIDVVPGRTQPCIPLATIPAGQELILTHVSAQAIIAGCDRAELVILVCNSDATEVFSSHFVKLEKVAENPACRTQTWLASHPFSEHVNDPKEDRVVFAMVVSALYGPTSDGFSSTPFKKPARVHVNLSGRSIN